MDKVSGEILSIDTAGLMKLANDKTLGLSGYKAGNDVVVQQFAVIAPFLREKFQGRRINILRSGTTFDIAIDGATAKELDDLKNALANQFDTVNQTYTKDGSPVDGYPWSVGLARIKVTAQGDSPLSVLTNAQNIRADALWKDQMARLGRVFSNEVIPPRYLEFLDDFFNPNDTRGLRRLTLLNGGTVDIGKEQALYANDRPAFRQAVIGLLTGKTPPQGIVQVSPNDLPEKVKEALVAIHLNPADVQTMMVSVQADGTTKDYAITMISGFQIGFDENGIAFGGGVPASGMMQQQPQEQTPSQPSSNSLLDRAGEMWMNVFQFYNSIVGGAFMQWNIIPLIQTPISLAQQGIGWAMGVLPFRTKPVITYQKGLKGIEIDTRTLIGSRVDKLRVDMYRDAVVYVALDNNKIIGVAVIKPISGDGSHGKGELFEVDPLYRSEPVALQLMNMVLSDPQWDEITFTIDPNYSRIVNPSLFGGSKFEIISKLIRFYKGFGFKQPDPQILEMEWRRN
jgi:hypothetical protein